MKTDYQKFDYCFAVIRSINTLFTEGYARDLTIMQNDPNFVNPSKQSYQPLLDAQKLQWIKSLITDAMISVRTTARTGKSPLLEIVIDPDFDTQRTEASATWVFNWLKKSRKESLRANINDDTCYHIPGNILLKLNDEDFEYMWNWACKLSCTYEQRDNLIKRAAALGLPH